MRLERKFKVAQYGDIHDASIVLTVDPGKSSEPDTVKFAKCAQAAIDAFAKNWRELR